jgi:hypothetical protein
MSLEIESKTNSVSFIKKHWLTAVFLFGFVTDYLLLNRVDDKLDNFILLAYVTLSTISIMLFYVGVSERWGEWWTKKLRHYMPILMQYSFGGLLSGMLIFYGRSGDLLVSAPFLLLIILVILINELLKKQSDRLVYNLSVYFVGVFAYCVLVVPVFVHDMGNIIFFASGVLALLIITLMVKILSGLIPRFLEIQSRTLVFVIGSLYMVFNGFYFFNIIPPIPLSLTKLDIYQQYIEKTSNGYVLSKESKSWHEYIPFAPDYFHPSGYGAVCFARVYAPTKLTTSITHRWQYLDSNGNWQDRFTKKYTITGENKQGYGGYTISENITDGKWRCTVENERGQVLGRKTFVVDSSKKPEGLVTVTE